MKSLAGTHYHQSMDEAPARAAPVKCSALLICALPNSGISWAVILQSDRGCGTVNLHACWMDPVGFDCWLGWLQCSAARCQTHQQHSGGAHTLPCPFYPVPLCKLPCQDSSLDSRFGELTVRLFSFPSLSSSSRTAIRVVASRVKWRRFLFWTAAMQQNIQGSQGIWITFHYRTQQGG